jgi:uncharacterized membrane protein YcjF (UPF0283 family)
MNDRTVSLDARIEIRPRNWFALLALWTALAAWLILVGTIVAVGSDAVTDNIFNVTGWVALGFGTAALVFSVAGITMIRTRGETALAILALVLTLSLTSFVSPLLFGFVR